MIIIQNKGGLGNCLINLFSSFRLSEKHNTKIDIKNYFLELFQIKNLNENNINLNPNLCNLLIFDDDNIDDKYIILKKLEKNKNINVKTISHNDKYNELNNISNQLNKIYGKYLENIIINKKIINITNKFQENFNDKTISVHIRSWNSTHWDKSYKKGDPNKAKNRHNNQFDLQKFIIEMNKYPDNNFFVASDNQKYINKLIEIFGNKIIFFNKKENLTQKEIDFIDILLLSKNNILIGTYNSTFTKSAWIFNKFQSKLFII